MTEQALPPQVGDVYQQMTAMMTSHWVSQAVRAVADLCSPITWLRRGSPQQK